MARNEGVAQPGHAQHADDSNHTGLEDGLVSDFTEFDLTEDRDAGTNQEHQGHDSSVTRNDNRLDEANGRGDSGSVEHNSQHTNQEDHHRALSIREQLLFRRRDGSLDQTLGQTILVDRVRVEVHVRDEAHHESRQHTASKRRNQPNAEQYRVGPAEAF